VKFAQKNALKAAALPVLPAQNLFLSEWESGVADTAFTAPRGNRLQGVQHSGTRQLFSVASGFVPVFEEAPARSSGWLCGTETAIIRAAGVCRRQVGCAWEARLLRVINHRREVIAVHAAGRTNRRMFCSASAPIFECSQDDF